jgi:DNA-binding transcriptional regulator YiaG
MTNSQKIKAYRKKHNLSQPELVQKFSSYGLTIGTLRAWEQGRRNVQAWFLKLLEQTK